MKHMSVTLIDCWIRCCRLCAPVQLPCLGHCNAFDSVTAGNVGHADKVMAGSVRQACCRIRTAGEMEAGLPASSFVGIVCLYMVKEAGEGASHLCLHSLDGKCTPVYSTCAPLCSPDVMQGPGQASPQLVQLQQRQSISLSPQRMGRGLGTGCARQAACM